MTEVAVHDEQTTLRDRFMKARAESGLSQEDAARALGMSVSSVARKERGEQPTTRRDVAAAEQMARDARLGKVPRGTRSEPVVASQSARRSARDWFRDYTISSRLADFLAKLKADLRASDDELEAAHRGIVDSPYFVQSVGGQTADRLFDRQEFEDQFAFLMDFARRQIEHARGKGGKR